ncbi:MAG: GAF domain-containing protein [Candidatus Omnitrophota bacterium]|nr:GAF domain-containing protein [Candidatus Omnitrophota bacterium]MDZ4241734.1 GAF domain-containing protein [Candidatus Omnitrophota bacterium]
MTTSPANKNIKLTTSPQEEIKILRKIVDLASSDMDLNLVLKEVVKVVNEMTLADSIFIYLFDETRKRLVLRASKIPHKSMIGKIVLHVGEGITGWVARENRPVAIPKNAYQDSRFKGFDVLPEDRYEAFLSVPIIYKGRVSGVINVQHRNPHVYPARAVNLINTIAKQVGGVIEHARLFEDAEKKAAQFDSLVKVSQSITSEHYLDEILSLIVVVTAEMLNSKICSILLLNETGEELVIKATQSLSEDYKRKPNVKVNASLIGEVVKFGKALTVADVRQEQRYFYRELAVKEHLSSMVAVPMTVKDKVIGVICVYTQEPHEFTAEEINVLQMVANQAAVAVENTKLVEEALKAREALETRKLIERAKGILMRMSNLSEEAAYKVIHKKSMDTCKTMKEIAESLILMDEIQNGAHKRV